MTRANLHPNPLSGYSEDYPDPEDCADCGGTDCHRCERPGATWKAACNDLAHLAADERERTILLSTLLTRAREFVADALDAHEHSDGRDLLNEIDAALEPAGSDAGEIRNAGQ